MYSVFHCERAWRSRKVRWAGGLLFCAADYYPGRYVTSVSDYSCIEDHPDSLPFIDLLPLPLRARLNFQQILQNATDLSHRVTIALDLHQPLSGLPGDEPSANSTSCTHLDDRGGGRKDRPVRPGTLGRHTTQTASKFAATACDWSAPPTTLVIHTGNVRARLKLCQALPGPAAKKLAILHSSSLSSEVRLRLLNVVAPVCALVRSFSESIYIHSEAANIALVI